MIASTMDRIGEKDDDEDLTAVFDQERVTFVTLFTDPVHGAGNHCLI